MNSFIKGAINKSRTSLSVLFLLSIAGFFALNYLPKATEPDVSFPGAYIALHTKAFLQKTQKGY